MKIQLIVFLGVLFASNAEYNGDTSASESEEEYSSEEGEIELEYTTIPSLVIDNEKESVEIAAILPTVSTTPSSSELEPTFIEYEYAHLDREVLFKSK